MFGLMKRADRLAYCGSCKTLGAIYGQKARLVLNHDIVFLAELLMIRSGTPQWTPAHRSFNCFTMPTVHPDALRYAAAASLVLAKFQIDDHLSDTGAWRYRGLKDFFSPAFRKAAADLRASGFPMDEMASLLRTQPEREARAASLDDVAEPTARATEMIFGHPAPELASIGRRFGYLIYVLDAWEDREKDAKSGDFNALLAFPEINGRSEILSTTESLVKDLPAALGARLKANVEERLGMRLRVVCGSCRQSIGDRWKSAVAYARSMKEKERAGFLKGAAVLASVSVLAFLAPHQIRSAESWRHALGMTLNLMAFGGIFATVPVPGPNTPPKKTGGCDWCGGCCAACDCCECCGSCCECGSCCDC